MIKSPNDNESPLLGSNINVGDMDDNGFFPNAATGDQETQRGIGRHTYWMLHVHVGVLIKNRQGAGRRFVNRAFGK